jgi:hypothetical protein
MSDVFAFVLETDEYEYLFDVKERLKHPHSDNGEYYFRKDKKTEKLEKCSDNEIVDILKNHPDRIVFKCPCTVLTKEGKLKPLVEDA